MLLSFREALAVADAVKPVVGDLTLTLGSWGVQVSGRVQTLLKLTCGRCLRAYFQSLNVVIDEQLVHQVEDRAGRRDRELLKDDFVEPIPINGMLDIGDIVYQAVTLASPTFCLCGEECPGPPLPDGAGDGASLVRDKQDDSKLDPRWKNLKTLFPKEDSGQKS
jgi:uncharacterized protein